MRYAKLIGLFLATLMGCTCAQASSEKLASNASNLHEGTVACKTEAAMLKIMKTMTPELRTNKKVLNELIANGDCLILPEDWDVVTMKDPPLNQQADHASNWTVRTPNGTLHMWGAPFGGD